ncbi:hypothetical protein AVEN_116305-1 [Araneus ventricosus]|uniref:Uncharacterized protein n=1 Tax=Araneus ventricosus TaxID=182803 RepID=A0A4Y2JK42_ARAVE|nr:hypothetical protein AVEN_116305-1 [Araneus ventricosus]
MMDIDALNEAMTSVDRIIASIGECPVLNCTKHPAARNADSRSEGEASICTDMDTSYTTEKQSITPPGEGNDDDEDFQMVSPRKEARETQQLESTEIETANMFTPIAEENRQEEVQKCIPEINLKIIANCNLILKEISQQFPKTENRIRRDFIGIKADTEENTEKIINFLKHNTTAYPRTRSQDGSLSVGWVCVKLY